MKKYIRCYREYDGAKIINPEDADYYDNRLWEVALWGGVGYYLDTFQVYADSAETALEIIVAYCERRGFTGLIYTQDEIDIEDEDYYVYVDATMEGASQPYYVLNENLIIREV